MPTHKMIKISEIKVGPRLRAVNPDWVEALSVSIAANGLQSPILVRMGEDGFDLVAGANRLQATELLGAVEIAANIRFMSDDQARLAEIDENLIRSELTVLDRAISLTERKEIHERIYPETKHGGDRTEQVGNNANLLDGEERPLRFTEDAAARTGLGEAQIQRAVRLAKRLSPEVIAALNGMEIADNEAQLLRLIKSPPEEQMGVIQIMKDRGIAKVSDGERAFKGGPAPEKIPDEEVWTRKMLSLWATGNKRWQDKFLEQIKAVRA